LISIENDTHNCCYFLADAILLNDNKLTSTIPSTIGLLQSITFIGLSNNELTGTIPKSFYGLQNLELAYLSNNTLTGTISPQYGDMESLRDLYLDGNNLTGTIPGLSQDQIDNSDLGEYIICFPLF